MNNALMPLAERIRGCRVLVVGEAMLDSYLEGTTRRLCREAPVPVVDVERSIDVPGGAANTALNACAMGAEVSFLSVVGDDFEGQRLRDELERHGVPSRDVLVERGRRTLTKRRVVADGQMLVRCDHGDTGGFSRATRIALLRRLRALFARADAVILSDYGYGVFGHELLAELASLHAIHPRILVADSRDLERFSRLRCTAVKPNWEETIALLGAQPFGLRRVDAVAAEAKRLLELTGAQMVAVTLDRDGAMIVERGVAPYHTGTPIFRHAQVAGAGDTFTAAMTLALAAGATSRDAVDLAAAAASIVVSKDGTAVCSGEELREHLSSDGKYISDRASLAARAEAFRAQGRRIVFTNGCFDILHSGHITYLNRARGPEDVLIVGLNADESVRRLKGDSRPVNTLDDRARVLAALSCVDLVVPFEEDTPEALIRLLRPDLYVKGGDYTEETLKEASLVRELGGTVQILPFVEDRSTSRIIERIRGTQGFVQAARMEAAKGATRDVARTLVSRRKSPLRPAG